MDRWTTRVFHSGSHVPDHGTFSFRNNRDRKLDEEIDVPKRFIISSRLVADRNLDLRK